MSAPALRNVSRPALATLGALLALGAPIGAQPAPVEGMMGPRATAPRIGGHAGVVIPSVRRAAGRTTDLTDRLVVGVPVGLTVRPGGAWGIDFEFIPTFNTGTDLVVTAHPGVVYGVARHFAVGVRAAYDAGAADESYGLTPLLARGFRLGPALGWFAELDAPIRRVRPVGGRAVTSVALAAHVGLTF